MDPTTPARRAPGPTNPSAPGIRLCLTLEQRTYVLLDDGFQISQPPTFPEEQRDWWYCDLVRVTDTGDELLVEDLWIDVIIGPPDHPYRVLDLDEYAEAATQGGLRRPRPH